MPPSTPTATAAPVKAPVKAKARVSGGSAYEPAYPEADRKALAVALGVKYNSVIRILSGAQRPGEAVLAELARELGVTAAAVQEALREARVRRAAASGGR